MATEAFSASLLIDTAKANKDIRALNQEVGILDKSLASLGKTLKENQRDLDGAVKAISSIVTASRESSKASEESAKAKLAEARAAGELAKAENAAAIAQARVERERSAAAVNTATAAYREARTEATNFMQSQRALKASTDQLGNSLANQRYLLYDVGDTYRTLGLAASALPAAAIASATAYEKSFAQVIRVSGAAGTEAQKLRDDLKNLATEIPLSFGELSNIAQIGGQMNIATDQLSAFTETVAKFVATADGATIDSSTQAFGRLSNLFAQGLSGDEQAKFFERIGSAISYTADTAVTSEAKIIAMLDKISPIGAQAGLAADEVVGLASAMSSVGLAPEISSGFLTRFFGQLNKDVAEGGDALNAYNSVLGTTSEQFMDMYRNDPAELLQRLIKSMSELDKVGQTSALGDLGITATRDQRVVQALAGSYDVLADAMTNSSQAYAEAGYLDKSSAGIFNTLAANLEKLGNSFANLGDTLGSGILPVLSDFVGVLQFAVDGLTNLANTNPAVKAILATLLTIGSVAGVFFALKSATAFFQAGLVTLTHITKQSAGGTLTFRAQLKSLATQMLVNKGMSEQAAASYVKQVGAVRALGTASALSGVQMRALNVSMLQGNTASKSFGGAIKGAGSMIAGLAGGPIGIAVTALGLLGSAWLGAAADAKASAEQVVDAFKASSEAGLEALGKDFSDNKIGFFESNNIKLMGKTYGELADDVGLSMGTIAKAMSEGSKATDELVQKLQKQAEAFEQGGERLKARETEMLIEKIQEYANQLDVSEDGERRTAEAAKGVAGALDETGDSADGATDSIDDYARALNDAIQAAFGLTNAQAGVNAALESLGAGVQKSGTIGVGSGDARSNLADFQQALSAQAAYLQQQVELGKLSAESGAQEFQAFAQGLLEQLGAMGVDTSEIIGDTQNAIAEVNNIFAEQGGVDIPVSVDSTQAIMGADEAMSWMADYLNANPQLVTIGMQGDDSVSDRVYSLVSYISEATGMDFTAVVNAITSPAGENTENVTRFMMEAVNSDFTAYINADTATAANNVQNFATYTARQLAELQNSLNSFAAQNNNWIGGVAGSLGNVIGSLRGSVSTNVLATPGQAIARANKAAVPSFKPLTQGYNDAAKAARNTGKAAGGAGRAAKKANDDTAKGAKKAGKAVQDQKKDWDELEQQISGYASRVGTAFGYVTARQTGVAEAKDEYYSILDGIKERLEDQKQSVRDLRMENKSLNAERKVQLNDAAKLEKMANYADQMGNGERAKVYRDEAKALRASADETKSKVDANEKEAKSIEKGMGKLDGYSKAAIANRKELRQLRDASLAVAQAYAASGASAKTVATQTAAWTSKAKAHAKELGYTNSAVAKVTGSTNSYVTALKKVPKTVTTKLTATNSTASGVAAAKKSIGSIPSSKTATIKAKSSGVPTVQSQLNTLSKSRTMTLKAHLTLSAAERNKYRQMAAVQNALGNFAVGSALNSLANTYAMGGLVGRFARGGLIPGTPPSDPKRDNIMATVDGKGMAAIRSGEYIQSQPAVDYYGTDIMDKINKMEIPRYALGGQIGNSRNDGANGVSVIELGAESIQNLARAAHKEVNLYVDSQVLARSVNQGMTLIAQQGGHF